MDGERLTEYDPSVVEPAFVGIRLSDRPSTGWIAVGLNDRIAGLGRFYMDDEQPMAMAMIDVAFLRPGRNTVDVFLVHADDSLERVEQTR
jgi:hypothetical protein